MTSHRLQKRSVALGAFICMFCTLCLWMPFAQAEGEEPFIGVIQKIIADTITVEVSQELYSEQKIGDQIILHLRDDTRVVINDAIRLKPVSKDLLSSGSQVWVKPNMLSDKVEADIVLILKRRVK